MQDDGLGEQFPSNLKKIEKKIVSENGTIANQQTMKYKNGQIEKWDRRDTIRAMVDGIEAGEVGEEGLCGADVTRRPLTLDVLLPRLKKCAAN